jgi:hypothetical protein
MDNQALLLVIQQAQEQQEIKIMQRNPRANLIVDIVNN